MKKKIISASIAAVFVLACLSGRSVFLKAKNQNDIDFAAPETNHITAFSPKEDERIYTVKEFEEKIGIFLSDSNEPFMVLDIFTFLLPESDREMLRDGFDISKNRLYSVIEDYTG